MKAGKALDEKKADIRIQFKHPVNTLFSDVSPNELVLRVGPEEAVYLKMTTKQPGLEGGVRHSELDLSYKKRYAEEMKDMPEVRFTTRAWRSAGVAPLQTERGLHFHLSAIPHSPLALFFFSR